MGRARPAWERLPIRLRLAGLASACVLATVGALFVLGYILVQLAPLTLAVAATLFLTALLYPVYIGLRRLKLPSALAARITLLSLLTAIAIPVTVAWNAIAAQFSDLATRLSEGVARIRDLLASSGSPFTPEQLDELGASASQWLQASSLQSGARTITEVAGAILLSVVLLFFAFKDGSRMWGWTVSKAPENRRDLARDAGTQAWETLTRYARGTALIALIDALGIGAALLILNVPLAFPLALIVFVGAFVPILGATVTGSIAVLVALAANGPTTALLTLGAVILVQQIEGNLLEPLIMKRQVRLHPVVTLVAVTAGTLVWGIAGAFVAVPLTAVGYCVTRVVNEHRSRRTILEPEAETGA